MPAPSHFDVINPGRAKDEIIFSQFNILPKELRLLIWRFALERNRLIQLRLEPCEPGKDGLHYRLFVDGYHALSKFLRVNMESREAALSFYRVHIPCIFMEPTTSGWNWTQDPRTTNFNPVGTFYFNPEHDFLQISPDSPVKDTLVRFLYDLKINHDPRGIGLLNLAADINDLNANDLFELQPSNVDFELREVFSKTLTQLWEVFFDCRERAGRQVLGMWSGLPTSDVYFNRSIPIDTPTPVFDRISRDPRPINEDLRRVFAGTSDSRTMVQLWLELLKRWDISAPQIQYKYLFGFDPALSKVRITDRMNAQRWLKEEDDVWKRESSADREIVMETDLVHEEEQKPVMSAFGFWLFPLESLGPVTHEEGFEYRAKRIADMRQYWPELALSSLP